MAESPLKSNNAIFCEMMSHPALFAHHNPKAIAIIGDQDQAILTEVIKHTHLTTIHVVNAAEHPSQLNDSKIHYHSPSWLNEAATHSLDILIDISEPNAEMLKQYFNLLHKDGILLQAAASPFEPEPLKLLANEIKTIGFHDLHILNFPQPNYPTSWRTAFIALKQGVFKRPREKAIYNKSFTTHYYNFDIHRASMVLPEFMRDTII